MTQDRQKLPPESEDNVVEVELRHIVFAFTAIVTVTFVGGTALLIIRDYAKYRRQKAVIDAAGQFIQSLKQGGYSWKNVKEDTSFQVQKSDIQPKP